MERVPETRKRRGKEGKEGREGEENRGRRRRNLSRMTSTLKVNIGHMGKKN